MNEVREHALLLRRIPYGESSLVCHFLGSERGRIALMARGVRRARGHLKAALAPLHDLVIRYRPGRRGMGTLLEAERGELLVPEAGLLEGMEIVALAGRLFPEGDPHGYRELRRALAHLAHREPGTGLLAGVWSLLADAGWAGEAGRCWHCGRCSERMVLSREGRLACASCGRGRPVAPEGLRRIADALEDEAVRLGPDDAALWRGWIADILRHHGIRPTDGLAASGGW